MKTRPLDIAESLFRTQDAAAGPRDAAKICAEILCDKAEALYAFTVRQDRSGPAELIVLGASGLDAATFRRLEQRVASTAIQRVFEQNETIYLLVNDEPSLDFLSIAGRSVELIAAPFEIEKSELGCFVAAFDKRLTEDRSGAAALVRIAALTLRIAIFKDEDQKRSAANLDEEAARTQRELKERHDVTKLIGNSGAMRQVADQIAQISRSNTVVLLRGEGGTGKETLAYAIHYSSLRSQRPFLKVNCSGVPEHLLEKELFGTEGEIPSAGAVEKARFGTLLIAEVGALSLSLQRRILRLIRDSRFERVGGDGSIRANLRLIFSTGLDLDMLAEKNEFDRELLYRINVFTVFVPPLRDRKADILLMAEHFIEKYSRLHRRKVARISTPAIDMLAKYHFPGNVRELENVIERAVMICEDSVIHARHLPATLQTAEETGTQSTSGLDAALAAFERDIIEDALKSSRGNIAKAARNLLTTERILGYRIKNAGIDPRRYK